MKKIKLNKKSFSMQQQRYPPHHHHRFTGEY